MAKCLQVEVIKVSNEADNLYMGYFVYIVLLKLQVLVLVPYGLFSCLSVYHRHHREPKFITCICDFVETCQACSLVVK